MNIRNMSKASSLKPIKDGFILLFLFLERFDLANNNQPSLLLRPWINIFSAGENKQELTRKS